MSILVHDIPLAIFQNSSVYFQVLSLGVALIFLGFQKVEWEP